MQTHSQVNPPSAMQPKKRFLIKSYEILSEWKPISYLTLLSMSTITLEVAAVDWTRIKCSSSAGGCNPSVRSLFKGDRSWAQRCLSLRHQEDGSGWHPEPHFSWCSLCPACLSALGARCWGQIGGGWVTQQLLHRRPATSNKAEFTKSQACLCVHK